MNPVYLQNMKPAFFALASSNSTFKWIRNDHFREVSPCGYGVQMPQAMNDLTVCRSRNRNRVSSTGFAPFLKANFISCTFSEVLMLKNFSCLLQILYQIEWIDLVCHFKYVASRECLKYSSSHLLRVLKVPPVCPLNPHCSRYFTGNHPGPNLHKMLKSERYSSYIKQTGI